jgi:metal-responsive CopG/Arc/MetJ family transcriptional regulator
MAPRAAVKTKKILVEFPEDLLQEAERVADDLSTDRSKLIRSAVRSFLAKRERVRLAQALAEGYIAHADFDRHAVAEFDDVDLENF